MYLFSIYFICNTTLSCKPKSKPQKKAIGVPTYSLCAAWKEKKRWILNYDTLAWLAHLDILLTSCVEKSDETKRNETKQTNQFNQSIEFNSIPRLESTQNKSFRAPTKQRNPQVISWTGCLPCKRRAGTSGRPRAPLPWRRPQERWWTTSLESSGRPMPRRLRLWRTHQSRVPCAASLWGGPSLIFCDW